LLAALAAVATVAAGARSAGVEPREAPQQPRSAGVEPREAPQQPRGAGVEPRGAPQQQRQPGPGCVTFFGDVMLGRDVAREVRRRKADPWAALKAVPQLARTWVGNFEGALVASPGVTCVRHDGLCLGVTPDMLDWLRASPFRALSLANNHAGDFGAAGRVATRAALASVGIAPLDADTGPTLLDVDGTGWALVALNLAGNSAAERQRALERARLQIGLARAQTPRVVVLPHWGREGKPLPAPEQENWGALFGAWGATVIAGSHAHVIQPVRCEAETATYFGLGNDLFDEVGPSRGVGLAVTCCPREAGLRCDAAETERTSTSAYPAFTDRSPAPPCAVDVAAPDRSWLFHPDRATFLFVQPLTAAGPRTFFALRRHWASFDREDALRPYVFRVEREAATGRTRIVDVWRGTSLARPLVAARLIPWRNTQLLCAIHRDDTFLNPNPTTRGRIHALYRWTGFGFAGVEDEEAARACEEL
jgi:poly-gamma-glutamate synthesis protein (capsule biosynthesis protein)